MRRKCGECRTQPVGARVAQRDERASAPLDIQHGLPGDRDHVGAPDPRCARARPFRPRQSGAVGLSGIGGRQDQSIGILVSLALLPQPLDRSAERELRATEPFDEVSAPAETERLERAQLGVDRAVAARDPLRPDSVTSGDPLPL